MRRNVDTIHEKGGGISVIQKATTLLDIDLRRVIEKVRREYHLSLPSRVIMVDYDDKEGDLYIRFAEAKNPRGTRPTMGW
jgi:hypothetical protein